MAMKKILLTLIILYAMAGCATPSPVNLDYDTGANFGDLNTYNWMPASGNASANELLVKKIRNSVDSQLKNKGRKLATDNPDFLIAMEISGKSVYSGAVGVGMSVSIPVGRAGRISVGGGRSKPTEKREGTLVLDFVDAKTNSLLWRATATEAVNPAATPAEQQQMIDSVIAQMLAEFPPGK